MSNSPEWISVDDRLPEINQWVIVFEDDTESLQTKFINSMVNPPCDNYRVKPAKMRSIDSEGYPDWYLCYVGGGPAGTYRNVTHWQPMPIRPKSFEEKENSLCM